jgi:CheY-like chemotaxis protein
VAYIVLVEDRDEDIELTVRALRKARVDVEVVVRRDGVDGLAFFEGLSADAGARAELPTLVLLDISMPRMNGIELLARLRRLQHMRWVPIVMLTSSNEERDLVASYQNGANSCVCKPVAFADFSSLIALLGAYWVGTNQVPSGAFGNPRSIQAGRE